MGRTPKNACPHCLGPLDEITGICRPCHAARSRRWYSETSTVASAQRGLTAKLKRRLGKTRLDVIRDRLSLEQAGACACCGRSGKNVVLNTDWSLNDVDDGGVPLLRAAICRSCKIAVNRVVHPSRFTLQDSHLAMIEVYLRRPWQDANTVLVRAGEERVTARSGVLPEKRAEDARKAVTDDVVGFLQEVGALPA